MSFYFRGQGLSLATTALLIAASCGGTATNRVNRRLGDVSVEQSRDAAVSTSFSSGDGTAVPSAFAAVDVCKADGKAPDSVQKVLSKNALVNTLTDLFGVDAVTAAQTQISQIPAGSDPTFAFDSEGATMSTDNVGAYASVASAIATYMTSSPDHAKVLSPCLAAVSATLPANCVNEFLSGMGRSIYRRPLTGDEVAGVQAILTYAAARPPLTAIGLVLQGMLQARPFLYLYEEGAVPVAGKTGVYKLTPYELASRLSYFIWSSAPDNILLNAAASGNLVQASDIETQVRRLMADNRAKASLRHFYDQWLGLSKPLQPNFSSTFAAGIDSINLAQSSVDEVHAFLDDVTWKSQGSWSDALTSRTAYISDPTLAKIYGVSPKAAGVAQQLPSTRGGLLTRVQMLASGSDTYSPILRGALVVKKILCEPLASPNSAAVIAAASKIATLDPHQSYRDKTIAVTSDTTCQACHSIINPLGFAFGNFDAMGRYSTQEAHVIDGALVNSVPVDASVTPVFQNAPKGTLSGGAQLSAALADSPAAHLCFAQELVQYQYGRATNDGDSCAVQAAYAAITASDGSIQDALVKLATSPVFAIRQVTNVQ